MVRVTTGKNVRDKNNHSPLSMNKIIINLLCLKTNSCKKTLLVAYFPFLKKCCAKGFSVQVSSHIKIWKKSRKSPAGDQLWKFTRQCSIFGHTGNQWVTISSPFIEPLLILILLDWWINYMFLCSSHDGESGCLHVYLTLTVLLY